MVVNQCVTPRKERGVKKEAEKWRIWSQRVPAPVQRLPSAYRRQMEHHQTCPAPVQRLSSACIRQGPECQRLQAPGTRMPAPGQRLLALDATENNINTFFISFLGFLSWNSVGRAGELGGELGEVILGANWCYPRASLPFSSIPLLDSWNPLSWVSSFLFVLGFSCKPWIVWCNLGYLTWISCSFPWILVSKLQSMNLCMISFGFSTWEWELIVGKGCWTRVI